MTVLLEKRVILKISTKCSYGLAILMEISLTSNKLMTVKELSENLDISFKYLEQIIAILLDHNFVKSKRGAYGGYYLAKPPSEIYIFDVMKATEGDLKLSSDEKNYTLFQLWKKIEKAITDITKTTTLQNLIDNHLEYKNYTYII